MMIDVEKLIWKVVTCSISKDKSMQRGYIPSYQDRRQDTYLHNSMRPQLKKKTTSLV